MSTSIQQALQTKLSDTGDAGAGPWPPNLSQGMGCRPLAAVMCVCVCVCVCVCSHLGIALEVLVLACQIWSLPSWVHQAMSCDYPGPPHSEVLQYLSLHFASTLAVLSNLIVHQARWHQPLRALWKRPHDGMQTTSHPPCMPETVRNKLAMPLAFMNSPLRPSGCPSPS